VKASVYRFIILLVVPMPTVVTWSDKLSLQKKCPLATLQKIDWNRKWRDRVLESGSKLLDSGSPALVHHSDHYNIITVRVKSVC